MRTKIAAEVNVLHVYEDAFNKNYHVKTLVKKFYNKNKYVLIVHK